jgi:glycosyltransferase involved in cell wall biosynthesis
MLYKLLSRLPPEVCSNRVVSLTGSGQMAEKIEALDIPMHSLGMRRGVPDPRAVWRLCRLMRRLRPGLVQTWMYHADLIGGMAARLAGVPVAWNIRHSTLDPRTDKRTTLWTAQICARLSRFLPRTIVCCSETARRVHAGAGYDTDRMVVIPNGFDLGDFYPDPRVRTSMRRELGVGENDFLVGVVARFHPQKDHENLVRAAAILAGEDIQASFLLCGQGIDWDNPKLAGWIRGAGLEDRFHLLGRRGDVPRLTAALDAACLPSSHGEGFPNVLGEAMACGVPCVTTNVGDSADIVGDTGLVAPPGDPAALARALAELAGMSPQERTELGARARKRIRERFDLERVAQAYLELYSSLAAPP